MRVDRQIQTLFSDLINKKPKPDNTIERHTAASSLQGLHDMFTACKITYYTVFGTLLSVVREQSLFSYDHDIDVAIHRSDLTRLVAQLPTLLQHGFFISELGYSVIKLRSLPAHNHIDIWVIERAPVYTCHRWRIDHALFSHDYFSTPVLHNCYNYQVCTPKAPSRLLSEWYGPSWHIPNKQAFCVYRPVLSRLFAWPFITSCVPFRFSHDPKSCQWRPWVRAIVPQLRH